MHGVESVWAQCPFCGEPIELLVDLSAPDQRYIEDCEVCCRPIRVHARTDRDGLPAVEVSR
jgi:hypothetical protein